MQELARRLSGQVFDYLLTRFTEPNELFGPFDIRKLRDGELVTNTEGMLPEAALIFLDELLNANSAILNSLLMVLNERVFRRGRETWKLPTLMVIGASNRLPEDEAMHALFDRFLLRVHCDNVPHERLGEVLSAGWRLDHGRLERGQAVAVEDIRQLQGLIGDVEIDRLRPAYVALVERLRQAGIPLSDRRAVKLQRLVAAGALLCGRMQANATDLWVLRYIWDREEQREILDSLVQASVAAADELARADSHPRSGQSKAPNPEELAHDLERIGEQLEQAGLTAAQRSMLRDQLGVLAARCQWVEGAQQRRSWKNKSIRSGSFSETRRERPVGGLVTENQRRLLRFAAPDQWGRSLRAARIGLAARQRPGTGPFAVVPFARARRFRCLADGQLIAVDQRVPSGVLPQGDWTALTKWLTCSLPPTVWPGSPPSGVVLHLVRVSTPLEPSLLLLPFSDWQAYITTAPQVRLDRLAFALDSAGRALVRGMPLPPLVGQRFVDFQGIAVPVGWHWEPAVDAATLRELFGFDAGNEDCRRQPGDLALLTSADCSWELVPAEAFVQVTRSAVRRSAEGSDERS